jgi:hypothetical protein
MVGYEGSSYTFLKHACVSRRTQVESRCMPFRKYKHKYLQIPRMLSTNALHIARHWQSIKKSVAYMIVAFNNIHERSLLHTNKHKRYQKSRVKRLREKAGPVDTVSQTLQLSCFKSTCGGSGKGSQCPDFAVTDSSAATGTTCIEQSRIHHASFLKKTSIL